MRKNLSSVVSACRHCLHYAGEGRRGGQCQQLGVPVQGAWKACPFALPPFAPSWESLESLTEDLTEWRVVEAQPVPSPCAASMGHERHEPLPLPTVLPTKIAV